MYPVLEEVKCEVSEKASTCVPPSANRRKKAGELKMATVDIKTEDVYAAFNLTVRIAFYIAIKIIICK